MRDSAAECVGASEGRPGGLQFPWEALLPLCTLGSSQGVSSTSVSTSQKCPDRLPGLPAGPSLPREQCAPTLQHIHRSEFKADAVLPGEDVDSPAGC